MLTQEPDPFEENGAIDEQIRRLATDPPDMECPTGIAVRVLVKVKRRRLTLHAGYVAVAVLVLTTIGVSSFNLLESNPPGSQLASGTGDVQRPSVDFEDPGLAELDPEFLATPPPVISLELISEDQITMFHCLEALEEEF